MFDLVQGEGEPGIQAVTLALKFSTLVVSWVSLPKTDPSPTRR